jgi:hypothetical protein
MSYCMFGYHDKYVTIIYNDYVEVTKCIFYKIIVNHFDYDIHIVISNINLIYSNFNRKRYTHI